MYCTTVSWRYNNCVKIVLIRSFSGLYFPAFELNKERRGVSLRIHSECGKILTRKTADTDTFHAIAYFEWCSRAVCMVNFFVKNKEIFKPWVLENILKINLRSCLAVCFFFSWVRWVCLAMGLFCFRHKCCVFMLHQLFWTNSVKANR